jgi:putative membrane protein
MRIADRTAANGQRTAGPPRPPLSAVCCPLSIVAHAGHQHLDVSHVLRWWSFEPVVVTLLAVTALLYFGGVVRLWRAAGVGRGVGRLQMIAFAIGWLALFVALVSPVDTLGGILFSAHMVQHELLMLVGAPMIVLGRPLIAMLWALPARWRSPAANWSQRDSVVAAWHAITAPLVATIVHGLALWIWHLPSLYQATLRSEFIHAMQHTSFILTAALFWTSLIHGRYGRIGYGVGVAYVFITGIHSGALGALLTFAPALVYPIYGPITRQWGLDALEDQQLAGLIMWVPAGIILVVLGMALFASWLHEAERRVAFTRSEALREK